MTAYRRSWKCVKSYGSGRHKDVCFGFILRKTKLFYQTFDDVGIAEAEIPAGFNGTKNSASGFTLGSASGFTLGSASGLAEIQNIAHGFNFTSFRGF